MFVGADHWELHARPPSCEFNTSFMPARANAITGVGFAAAGP
jgi:hypothetical protein